MFIRRTRTRSIGDSYFTYRLVRSERTGAKVRQRTLAQSGTTLRGRPKRLAARCAGASTNSSAGRCHWLAMPPGA